MARYIDADKLIEALRADYDREGANAYEMVKKGLADASVKYSHGQFCYLNAMERVKDTPTADVVPKSEVAREIIDEFMSAMRVKHEENRPKYGGALALLLPDIEQIAVELKKKYTEGEG